MAKKKDKAEDFVKGWSDVITRSFEESRRKEQLLTPHNNMMRYYRDYSRAIMSVTERMNMIWDMFEGKIVPQEESQRIMDVQTDELERLVNELIGHMGTNRQKFHTHNYDKPEDHQGILTMHQLKRGLEEEGVLRFRFAIKEEDMYQDTTGVAALIDERIPNSISYMSIDWKVSYVLGEHLVLDVELKDFKIDEELAERIRKY